jgi:hypothetical protein
MIPRARAGWPRRWLLAAVVTLAVVGCEVRAGDHCSSSTQCPGSYHCALARVCTRPCGSSADCHLPCSTSGECGLFDSCDDDGVCAHSREVICSEGYCRSSETVFDPYGPERGR